MEEAAGIVADTAGIAAVGTRHTRRAEEGEVGRGMGVGSRWVEQAEVLCGGGRALGGLIHLVGVGWVRGLESCGSSCFPVTPVTKIIGA